MLFFRNVGKEEGEAAGRHCDNSSFISMLVCLFVSFFLSVLIVCLFNVYLLCDQAYSVDIMATSSYNTTVK